MTAQDAASAADTLGPPPPGDADAATGELAEVSLDESTLDLVGEADSGLDGATDTADATDAPVASDATATDASDASSPEVDVAVDSSAGDLMDSAAVVVDAAAETAEVTVAPIDAAAPPDAATQTDVAPPADATGACVAKPELCDGIDNDCDGATDEGFAWKMPAPPSMPPMAPLAVGEPCGMFDCAGGTVICQTPQIATCSNCPSAIDPTVILAPPAAVKSPLQATGSFTDLAPLLPTASLQIDKGTPLQVPYGSSGLAIDADSDGDLDVWWSDGVNKGVLWVQATPWSFQATTLATMAAQPAAVAALPGPLGPTLVLAGGALAALERQADGAWKNVASEIGLAYAKNEPPLLHALPADVNDDGTLDLVGSVFSCTSGKKALVVWLSRGTGGYVEAASTLGLLANASPWATMQTDYDDDGLQDLLVLTESCNPNPGVIFYRHQPLDSPDATYVMKKAPPVFTAPGKPAGSPMGAAHADLNGDGVLDYLLAEIELNNVVKMGGDPKNLKADDPWLYGGVSNHLLLSQPNGARKQAGWQAGVWAPLAKGGHLMVAWSPALTDLDHDGHVDILLSHGNDFGAWATANATLMRPVVWRNDGTQVFVDMSAAWGLPDEHDGRSLVLADLDGDGDDDLVLGGQAVPPRILRNDLVHKGADLRVSLQGATSNPWGLGARIKLQTNLRSLVQEHSVQAPSQAIGAPLSHFALMAGEQPQTMTVKWPSGWVQTVAAPAVGKLTVNEPKLVELSTRWSPKGQAPVTVTAWHLDPSGQPVAPPACSIELADGSQGQWSGPATCTGNACARVWTGAGVQPGGSDAVVAHCGGKALSVRPRIFY